MAIGSSEQPARFASTHWSVVAAAAESKAPGGAEALERLCAAYWYPLYAFLRRKGHSAEEAEDLTQSFFAERVVTRRALQELSPEKGKFRTWLLTCLNNHVAHERQRDAAKKRGGDVIHVPLELPDLGEAEGRYQAEPFHNLNPEKLYERAWALALLDHAHEELQSSYIKSGRGDLFQALRGFLPGANGSRPHAEVAKELGKSEDSVKMAVSRFRQEFGRVLRSQIQKTVADERQAEEELRDLIAAVGATN
ncbi:MAG TPA: sigma factor [Candidatus Limnocylindria bacterium]|jgi:RNA polymerase sigma-70 factor (ECF subfamily)|nr:sigma factor [Candidatus Limnocylindria bacterium]